MEILTLLKANIRRRKGSFISVILLTLIIAISVTAVLSIKESTVKGVIYAHQLCNTPDLLIFGSKRRLTDEALDKAKSYENTGAVRTVEAVIIQKAKLNGNEHRNTMMLYEADNNTKTLKEDLSGINDQAPKLKKGEILVSQGLLTVLNGKVGQKITLETLGGDFEFTVKGILLDSFTGSALIGWKTYCVCHKDFSEIYKAAENAETENMTAIGRIIEVSKSKSCNLSDTQFRRQLNLDTGIVDSGFGSLPKYMSINYTTLLPETVCSCLLVFVMLLLAIVVIVTVHSISMEIESDYVTFGILKAQGFDKNKIRLLFMGQYMWAELIGVILGIVLSIPLVNAGANVFAAYTAVPGVLTVPIPTVSAIILALFLLSAGSVFFITKKVGKISPVRAVSGAKKEIYFDSRIKFPISKRLLSQSLALRQFTSAKRRYIGTMAIAVVLVFFMTTVTMLANTVNSKTALESMGEMVGEIIVSPKENFTHSDYKKIEKEIEAFSPIRKSYYTNNLYFSFEGEEMMCCIYEDPSMLPVLKGRSPVYDNEIAVTPTLLEEFGLKIGDTVTVGYRSKKNSFLISGTVQFMNDAGRCFLISYDAAKKIDYKGMLWGVYSLEQGDDKVQNEEIAQALNKKFGDIIEARAKVENIDKSLSSVLKAMQLIIYVFSVLFCLIVVNMICKKAFVQERTDYGIYKAVGFDTKALRRQFAFRFFLVSVIGAAIGTALSLLFSGKVLVLLLKSVGIFSFNTDYVWFSFMIPILITALSFLIFSYFAAGRIKRVKIRELVTE